MRLGSQTSVQKLQTQRTGFPSDTPLVAGCVSVPVKDYQQNTKDTFNTIINSLKSLGINWAIFFSLFIDLNTMPPALFDVQRPSVEFSVPNAESFSAFHQFLPHVQHLNALPVAFSQNFYHFGYHCY